MANPHPTTKFEKGNKFGGRPKGSRDKITERALALIASVLNEDDAVNAQAGLVKLRDTDPDKFWKIITGLMPKDIHVKGEHTITHIEEAVSITDAWVAGIIGREKDRRVKKPLPN